MFSLYHSSQKQFTILSRAVLVASNLAWSMHICSRLYIGHFQLQVSALTSPSICVSRQLFLVHYHVSFMKGYWSVKYCLLGESRANHEQLLLQISQSRKRKNSGTLKQFGSIFSKKEWKSRYKSNFQRVSLRRQIVCLWICHVTFLERTLRFGFLITLETLSFFSLKSSLEFIIITLHNMQKTRRSKERTNMDLHDNICQGSPIQFLTPPDRA